MSEPERRQPVTLAYASTVLKRGRPPGWAYVVIGLYVLLFGAMLLVPIYVRNANSNVDEYRVVSATVAVLVVAGLSLLVTPVRLARGRPVRGIVLWVPMLGVASLATLLLLGAGIAVAEFCTNERDVEHALEWVVYPAGAVWAVWTFVLWWISDPTDASPVAARFHRWLIKGSVAELLVAVPTHVVVRRREECCAGAFTGTAIGIGTVVMFLAFGPSVLMLYYRRFKKISVPTRLQTSPTPTVPPDPQAG